jgi:hypothetical protein
MSNCLPICNDRLHLDGFSQEIALIKILFAHDFATRTAYFVLTAAVFLFVGRLLLTGLHP